MPNRINVVLLGQLPDGIYKGKWGGYEIDIIDSDVKARTDIGVRGINIPITIEIKDGIVINVMDGWNA